jgi:hypothetical protein
VAPHAVDALLKALPERWMTNAHIIQYQALLIDQNRVKNFKTAALNPATLLLDDDPKEPFHDCLETLKNTQSLQLDLTDVPWDEPDEVLCTDGSSFVTNRVRYAGSAVVTLDQAIWAQAPGHGTSAQKAELITLTQDLMYGKDEVINVYTDVGMHLQWPMYTEPFTGREAPLPPRI